MGSFSWTRAEATTKRSNLTRRDRYKILVPKEFGGGYIWDKYYDYGMIGEETNGDYLYVDGNGEQHNMRVDKGHLYPDLYGILAYWNGCKDLIGRVFITLLLCSKFLNTGLHMNSSIV